ncbi:hypothetical protein PB2503_03217 [Parvularcula bermudensis HTCC2503]|uniref:Uncharacterized protein n=1 Tax=Parvularcula bermudensis (strain ATCC BAA-594 / HTCC2503 / KCTC 12087) TaxID=314260 RepID=E0TD61_PARBH|nr:cation:proton antiporter subunit C [Parvularcula bermudensis]ADM08720.1 hypothetical protein PB2503_03217 [Parvularcula bermudensis HTCC2503]
MVEFILARYNYWIVIILMMTGLYIVFARGNLVKTVIGLNVFQTSVFIFYITIGKVFGGTAPILVSSKEKSNGHGAPYDEPHHAPMGEGQHGDSDHGGVPALSQDEAAAYASGARVNSLGAADQPEGAGSAVLGDSLHDAPDLPSNALSAELRPGRLSPPSGGEEIVLSVGEHPGEATLAHGADSAATVPATVPALDPSPIPAESLDAVYSNPLPHVLILTAIVVGVATTAVGLALAVRIREAYGTIEEDELERMDNEAATGSPFGEGGTA